MLGCYLCPPKLPPERELPPPKLPPLKLPLELREPPKERLGAEKERVGVCWLGAEYERLVFGRSKLPRFMPRVEPPK